MKKSERADYILSELMRLYPDPAVPLDHFDTFSLLIAVLLSAQTTDKMVNQVTPDLWKLGRTPAELARRTAAEIRETIKRCGLSPQKSVAIQRLSEILVQEYAGEVPDSLEELEKLPGVGHKTASVVMCQAFGKNAFPVDTHIHRLAQRWGLTSGSSVVQTERDLKKLFPEESWNKLHLQIIYYGREHCTARGCDGTVCPICKTLYPRRKTPVETRK
jgi:endonuclease-3